MTTPHLADDLKRDEGCKLVAYQDTLGIWTVGVGHAHVPAGTVWTQDQCDQALAEDIAKAEALLDANAGWWRTLEDARQDVMASLCFNMGWGDGAHGLSSFKNTLAAIEAGDFERAAAGLLASKWATQVKSRSDRLATQLRTGVRA
ncbi:glycoside hydrolase family protein [Phenylobacterium sp.]|uniref:glycoside hydrolase family protein n=1 Tax=Phenylobacterium sp. TaxID=1871053 RepID=UPI0025FC0E6A|nr:glycoside hydrolase family protein [Phenylobacterium sp.]